MNKLKARLTYNFATKLFLNITRESPQQYSVKMPGLLKTTALTLLFTSGVLITQFYSGIMVTMTRKDTFYRNLALINAKYGETHKQAFG